MAKGDKVVRVNDRMQRGYSNSLTAPVGRNFDPEFRPELTRLGSAPPVRKSPMMKPEPLIFPDFKVGTTGLASF
jgi:hypothetical protein